MSQSTAAQIEAEAVMTEREAKQFAEIIETRKNLEAFYTGEWLYRDYPCHSEVIQRNHHEPNENCTGHLLITRIADGTPVYRRAIARLIARAPSMLQLLEKALLTIGNPPFTTWPAMRDLANEIEAEIDKAHGREA